MEILIYPNEILKCKAEPVKNIDEKVQKLVKNMLKTMYEADGIGLAANQVGELLRLLVIDLRERDDEKIGQIILINPVITACEGEVCDNEGCLSVPGYQATVKRFEKVLVEGINQDGNPVSFEAQGLLSRCIQHEIDHLDGYCFVDRLGPIKKALFKKKWQKKYSD